MSLFELGPFKLPSGKITHFKIECDALTPKDWRALARLAVEILPPFGAVEGVPRGGLAFAEALQPYAHSSSPRLLIADDVWVTGKSMGEHRAGRDALGIVAFTRTPIRDPWVFVLFGLNPAAEAVTHRLHIPPNIV